MTETTPNPKLQVVLAPKLFKRYDDLASEMGIDRADLARRALTEWAEVNYFELIGKWEQVN